MESGAKLAGHAVHPTLITVPLGLLGTAVVCDLVVDADGLATASFYVIAAGVIGEEAARRAEARDAASPAGRRLRQGADFVRRFGAGPLANRLGNRPPAWPGP